MINPNPSFWKDKRVLVTGHTGFKGGWLAIWLKQMGAHVSAVSLPPVSEPNLFEQARVEGQCDRSYIGDIRNLTEVFLIVQECNPEIVLHLAAQPLVRESYKEPVCTFATNVMGTVHLMESLRGLNSVQVAIMITTDKVYRNLETGKPFAEDDALGGHDPYSASKAACEIAISSYRDSFLREQGVALASVRAGNVIGGGDWSIDRLIPDIVKAWQSNANLHIRRPEAIRPWQHVLESLSAYLILAEKLWSEPSLSQAFNVGPNKADAASVRSVVELAKLSIGSDVFVSYADQCDGVHEAQLLMLENSKVKDCFGIEPRWNLQRTVEVTMEWYVAHQYKGAALELCLADIEKFINTSYAANMIH